MLYDDYSLSSSPKHKLVLSKKKKKKHKLVYNISKV